MSPKPVIPSHPTLPQRMRNYWESPNPVIVSYLTLRRVIGILGMAQPLILAIWGYLLPDGGHLLDSISDYYCLRTRDAFVGIHFTIAWFLYTYCGYTRGDDITSDLACLFALGLALFPNCGEYANPVVHYASAGGFFLVLAYISFFLFTNSGGNPTPQKIQRNKVYRSCAVVMVASVVLIAVYLLISSPEWIKQYHPVFWLEALAVWSFGFSWFVKGETILRDATN